MPGMAKWQPISAGGGNRILEKVKDIVRYQETNSGRGKGWINLFL
jgi:hypothetical protein